MSRQEHARHRHRGRQLHKRAGRGSGLHVSGRHRRGETGGFRRTGDVREAEGRKKGFITKEPIGDGTDVMDIPRSIPLPLAFPEKVKREAAEIPQEVRTEDLEGREDLRELVTVTIDGADARDLDDAVSLTETADGFELGVHIADVSYYVREGSALDEEALTRGTSVYLPDRVIPMLPLELSNGICSLNAGEDRLALSVLMELDRSGRLLGQRLARSVIRVRERMTYEDVRAILEDRNEALCRRYEAYVPLFERMHQVSVLLRRRRTKRGAIDFDFPEAKILFDEEGFPKEVTAERSDCAKQLIEDFMLAANETVAAVFRKRDLPFLYRVHEEPDTDKVEELLAAVRQSGAVIEKRKQKITPREIQQALLGLKGHANEAQLSRMILRTMQQAHYDVSPRGHFGLAAGDYCHFTSPIRRYPDLQIHRLIGDYLGETVDPERIAHYRKLLPGVARQTSMTERRAVETERETQKFEKCRYASRHLGEVYCGIVSGVVKWGLYVELPDTIEGLVPIASMCDDYYLFDEEAQVLRGRLAHRVYKLGDEVTVRIVRSDPVRRVIDFELE